MRFAPHRHDAYAIGITLRGVQSFGYRGTTLHSEAGCAFVIHPDETHDGRAGTDEGFGYRILYIAPRLISEALGSRALPFVRDAVTRESQLHRAICAALDAFDAPIEDLRFDDLIARLADALTAHDPAPQRIPAKAESAVQIAREYLDEACDLPSSATLERLTGLSRFELARQFRRCLGTSPHRYAMHAAAGPRPAADRYRRSLAEARSGMWLRRPEPHDPAVSSSLRRLTRRVAGARVSALASDRRCVPV